MSTYVTCRRLAQELGMDASHARKYILSKGFQFEKIRTPESGNQLANALTAQDAETIRALRQAEGYGPGTGSAVVNGWGFFYVIQLVPDLDGKRIKLGFTNDVPARLAAHRTSAPTAQLVDYWPCKAAWERTIIDSATRMDCRLILNEVYHCDDLTGLVERCHAIFALLPDMKG